jgi:hypothetical protein
MNDETNQLWRSQHSLPENITHLWQFGVQPCPEYHLPEQLPEHSPPARSLGMHHVVKPLLVRMVSLMAMLASVKSIFASLRAQRLGSRMAVPSQENWPQNEIG